MHGVCEAQLVELPNGDVMANMRNNHQVLPLAKLKLAAREHVELRVWGDG